ncbi:uncharacterized protein LOC133205823 [Saccostrea echinata]|uniref:uncharacterized protein LOC133205823 n=1 Tax=Saccostrea echinata TaxID=191078 RepID=UPI002A841571|nr:uncharacterized protein LOC133205823 [Saccostrea echinata]
MDEEKTKQIRPSHRLELRVKGLVNNIREGPYITHNYLASHVRFLKKVNEEESHNVYRVLPFGGSFNSRGDVVALLVWYFMLIYAITAIPLACYCEDLSINICNIIILATMVVYHLTAIRLIFSNVKKLKAMWCTTLTTAEKYLGLQNYFIDVTTDNAKEIHCVATKQRQKIIQKMTNKNSKQVVVMLMTSSYLRSRLRDPVICLSVMAIFCLIGLVVQLETLRVVAHNHA